MGDGGGGGRGQRGGGPALERKSRGGATGKLPRERGARLCHGLSMDGRQLKPAKVSVVQGQELRFILKEGRNRQIRRMCELVGMHVMDLVRIRIGALKLGDLPEGKWRVLAEPERAARVGR